MLRYLGNGGIGEVVNTPDCGSGMRGFDPHISPQNEKKSKDLLIEIDSYESIFLFARKEFLRIYLLLIKFTINKINAIMKKMLGEFI